MAFWIVASIADRPARAAARRSAASRTGSLHRARLLPRAMAGMLIAHLGIAVFIFGVDDGQDLRGRARRPDGASATPPTIGDLTFTLRRRARRAGAELPGRAGMVEVSRKGRPVATLHPEKRLYRRQQRPDDRGRDRRGLFRDLYVSLGEPVDGGAWIVRVYVKPFVDWIWGGCLVMALGGLLAAQRPALPRQACGARRDAVDRAWRARHEAILVPHSAGRLPGAGGRARGRPEARSARGAVAADRQAGAGVRPAAARRRRPRRSACDDMRGKVWLLNVWASWCVACREEHPLLVEFAKRRWCRSTASTTRTSARTPLAGCARFGNPYDASLHDLDGRVGIDFGVYGVPETFVIDQNGVIRLQAHRPADARGAGEQDRAAAEEARCLSRCSKAIVALLLALLPRRSAGAKEALPEAADPALEARMTRIAAELRCLVCQNQTIADSNAGLAVDLRREIRAMLRQGKSDAEIIDYMTARYGDFVLYRPPLKSTTALLWFGPAAMLLLGGDGADLRAAPADPARRRRLRARRGRGGRRRTRRAGTRRLGRRGGPHMKRDADFLAEARGRLQQLKSLHDAGRIDAKTFDAERRTIEQEIGAHLLDSPAATPRPRPTTRMVAGLAVAVAAVAVAGYLATGSPGLIAGAAPASSCRRRRARCGRQRCRHRPRADRGDGRQARRPHEGATRRRRGLDHAGPLLHRARPLRRGGARVRPSRRAAAAERVAARRLRRRRRGDPAHRQQPGVDRLDRAGPGDRSRPSEGPGPGRHRRLTTAATTPAPSAAGRRSSSAFRPRANSASRSPAASPMREPGSARRLRLRRRACGAPARPARPRPRPRARRPAPAPPLPRRRWRRPA